MDIAVATPGRLFDIVEARAAPLTRCTYLVLDGLDNMVDRGFEAQVLGLASQTRPDRQTLVFTDIYDEVLCMRSCDGSPTEGP